MISLLVRRRPMTSRMLLHLNYPIPRRANLTVTFDAADESGPFAARATLLEGEGLALTRESVDGLPDGEDRLEVFAPMVEAPLGGDNVYRTLGMIGIEGPLAEARGRVRVEVFDRRGRALAARIRSL
jgi:hypothetical protein